MSERIYVDWGKLVQIVIIIGATVALSLAGKISADAVMLILGGAAGYIFGNGKSVREGSPPAPLLGRRPADTQTWILEDLPNAEVRLPAEAVLPLLGTDPPTDG